MTRQSDGYYEKLGWRRCRHAGNSLLGHLWNRNTKATALIPNPPAEADLPEKPCESHRSKEYQPRSETSDEREARFELQGVYFSNAQRADMIKSLREMVARLESE